MGWSMIGLQERCYLDTNSIIAILERNTPATHSQSEFLLGISSGTRFCITSEIALCECLVKPIRDGDENLAGSYLEFIDEQLSAEPVKIDRHVLISAALWRATVQMKLPDALHVACAIKADCTVFVSADTSIKLPGAIRRISFDDL
jgi:predicted nucleic acid-binding protein